jgi:hypothetical protein
VKQESSSFLKKTKKLLFLEMRPVSMMSDLGKTEDLKVLAFIYVLDPHTLV